ncbi:MAG: SDR family NAD(P)-dependent oxidoreductase, partial [Clostridia bacterium]|nr:SDR family NAD(P)-dependent oxidoreductase [Clostridia bacterium]
MKILVTGGTGFIGSHTVVELFEKGHEVVIVDNLCNSEEKVLDDIQTISGKKPVFYKADIRDKEALEKIFQENKIDAVIHFAGLKAVGESVQIPLDYYQNNITGTLTLCEVMKNAGCKTIVF